MRVIHKRRQYVKYVLAIIVVSVLIMILNIYISDYNKLVRLENISDQDVVLYSHTRTGLIFFHETSNNITQRKFAHLNSRQGCSVESAARMNPNSKIFLLYTTSKDHENDTLYINKDEKILNALMMYKNVKIMRADLKKYTQNTPLEKWYHTGVLEKSKHLISHTSDVLRYLTLWKYGGTYLDLDVIITKNLGKLGYNYAVAESAGSVAAGILNLDYRGFGHSIADLCISETRTGFRGDVWAHNGPGVITRILKKVCDTNIILNMTSENCIDFTVLPSNYFYPVHYGSWKHYFDPKMTSMVLEKAKDSFGIHVWNKLSVDEKIQKDGEPVAYTELAKEYCPNVFAESGNEF